MYALVTFWSSSILFPFLKEFKFSLGTWVSGWGKDWGVNRMAISPLGKELPWDWT